MFCVFSDDQQSGRQKRVLGAATATILSGALSAGATLVGTTASALMATGYSVAWTMVIENASKFTMTNPQSSHYSGAITHPPVVVRPGKREVMAGRKTANAATGSEGWVSWDIDNQYKLHVYWSVPYNQNFDVNTLGVGITGIHDTNKPIDQTYRTREYYYDIKAIKFCEPNWHIGKFGISGTMSTSHHAKIIITVFPTTYENLAHSVKTNVPRDEAEQYIRC